MTLLVVSLFIGCGDEAELAAEKSGKMRVALAMPGCYELSSGSATRVVSNSELTTLKPFDDGTTLWLAVYENKGTADNRSYNSSPDTLAAYVVRQTSSGGETYSTLYRCEADDEGNAVSESSEPFYLESGKYYKFRAISPARKLEDNYSLHVRNGEYVLSSDDRYTQTESKEILITYEDDAAGITIVRLNPLVHQTAQMQFAIQAGTGVHDLQILPAGIEISGIQDADANDNYLNWMLADTLTMYLGDKNSWVTIDEFTTTTATDGTKTIVGKTGVLPTDATSNSIIVLLNLRVNEVNSQYTLMLNKMVMKAAHSYNFNITVNVEDGVSVAVWQNQSWVTDVNME